MNIQKCNASACWLDRFKNWFGFKNVNLHEEMGGVDVAAIGKEAMKHFDENWLNTINCIFRRMILLKLILTAIIRLTKYINISGMMLPASDPLIIEGDHISETSSINRNW